MKNHYCQLQCCQLFATISHNALCCRFPVSSGFTMHFGGPRGQTNKVYRHSYIFNVFNLESHEHKMSCFSIVRREIEVRGDRNFLNRTMALVVLKIPTRNMHLCCIRFVCKGMKLSTQKCLERLLITACFRISGISLPSEGMKAFPFEKCRCLFRYSGIISFILVETHFCSTINTNVAMATQFPPLSFI